MMFATIILLLVTIIHLDIVVSWSTMPKSIMEHDFLNKSLHFSDEHSQPTSDNWLQNLRKKNLVPDEQLLQAIKGSYPVLHERVLPLLQSFLDWKRQYGSNLEKKIYHKMNIIGLLNRLLQKVNNLL